MWIGHCGGGVFFCFAPEVAPFGDVVLFPVRVNATKKRL